jgi:hypothetical protein
VFAAILLDQRGSQGVARADLVDEWLAALNSDPALSLVRPFERTAGDEMEGLVSDPASLAAITLRALEIGSWWIGIGFGEVETPLPTSVRSGKGSAFVLARRAIESAKGRPRTGRSHRVRVFAEGGDPGDLEAALMLMAVVLARSGIDGSEAVRLRATGLTILEIAKRLAVSKQAVSQQLLAAHWTEQQAGRRLIEHLAGALLR